MDKIELSDELKLDLLDYLVKIDERVGSPNTLRSYGNVINRIFDAYEYLDNKNAKEMLKKWNKKTKIRAVFSKLNEYFDYSDIDFTIKIPKTKRAERHLPDILIREELEQVLNNMPKEARLIISCIFNIGAGLRISEVINLKWQDISWNEWSLENKTLTAKIRNSKRNKDRIVPIPHFTCAELYEYAKEIGNLTEEGFPKNGYIFNFGSETFKTQLRIIEPAQWKYEYTLHAYDFIRHNIINRYFKKISNKRITAHSLRHSRASELYNKYKVKLPTIQKWLGHSDIATTMIYVHLSSDDDKEIMEKVGGV